MVVGDVALLEPGEIVPCDGVFLSGHNVKCDESGATGETDAIKKVTYYDCLSLRDRNRGDSHEGVVLRSARGSHTDCFIVSGSKVLEGIGSYVVVAVGQKSFNGRIMMGSSIVLAFCQLGLTVRPLIALRGDTESTPLQLKLNDLAELIAKVGSAAGLILFTALMIRYFVQLGKGVPKR